MRARAVATLLSALLLAPGLGAAALTIDGQLSVEKVMGEPIQVQITGKPGSPALLLADVVPGPTFAYGQQLPLGFSPFVVLFPLPALPPSGVLTLNATVPALQTLDGQDIYLMAVVLDAAAPLGLAFSNGAHFKIVGKPEAGADQGTIVGRRALLDGSAAAKPDGTAKAGYNVLWTLQSTPSGSAAFLEDASRPFATLTPDVPGDYVARLQVNTPGGSYTSFTTVHAWRVVTSPFDHGAVYPLPSFPLNGTVEGPPVQSLLLDGQTVALSPTQGFGPLSVVIPAGDLAARLHFRIVHGDGTTANHHLTVYQGVGQSLAAPSLKTLAARLTAAGIAEVAELGEQQLEAADLKGALLSLPPQQVANETGPFGFTLFSATIDFTNLTYNPDMSLQLTPSAGGILALVTVNNVKADFDVWGEVLEVGYNLDGYITTNPTTIQATLKGSAAGGKLNVAVSNVVVNRANFDFELNGFLGTVAEAFVIESAVKDQVEATMASQVQAQLGPAIAEILNALVLEGNLAGVLQVDVDVAAPISGVVHDAQGATIQLDGKASVGVAEPGSPALTGYRATPTAAVSFGSTAPSGQPYEAALAVADDFINQVLAAATAAGLLDGDLTTLFPNDPSSPVNLPTDQLAQLFPNAGFDHFPVGTEVRLRAHGTVPPVLNPTPGGPGMARVHLDNLEVEFEVDTAYGALPLLLVSMTGAADVNVAGNSDGTLALAVQASSLELSVLRVFPGADPATMDTQVDFLAFIFNFALPDLIGAIGTLPLPTLQAAGLGLTPQQTALIGPGSTHVGVFGQLQFVPAGS